jgi:Xaa-Pro aminopeptidase
MYLTLVDILSEIGMETRLQQGDRIISALRQRKTASEVSAMKEAIRHALEIFAMVPEFTRPGRTEKEVAAAVSAERERRGLPPAWDERTCPAVFTGPDTAAAHYAPTDRRIEPGHILNMDFGVRVNGYCSDLQRTFYVLAPGETRAPADVQRGFDTIVAAVHRAKDGIRPGVPGVQVDAIARSIVTGAGYEEFPHGLGHQVGRFAHDGTALLGPAWEKYAGKPFHALEPGMVFTIEPRLTVPGRGIATIEEMVQVTDHGAEWLSSPQTELILIRR